MEKEKGPQAPVVNVVLPANFGLPPPVIVALPPAPLLEKPAGLIPPTLNEGPRMDIDTFCVVYELPDAVLWYFHENAITGTHAFSHIMDTDLTGMGFKIGGYWPQGGYQDVGIIQGKFLNLLSFALTIAVLSFYYSYSVL